MVRRAVLSVRNFLSPGECTWIIETAAGQMQASPVSLMDKDKGKARGSVGRWFFVVLFATAHGIVLIYRSGDAHG